MGRAAEIVERIYIIAIAVIIGLMVLHWIIDLQHEIRRVMIFLQSHGVGAGFAARIFKRYGQQAVEVVRHNPFRLAADVAGIGFPREKTVVVPPSVDLGRFNPERPLKEMRSRLGLRPGDFVVGIVARMQTHPALSTNCRPAKSSGGSSAGVPICVAAIAPDANVSIATTAPACPSDFIPTTPVCSAARMKNRSGLVKR